MTGEDYRAHYSTLFAVKLPFGEFHLDRRTLPISTLLEEFSSTFDATEQAQNVAAIIAENPAENESKSAPFVYLKKTNQLIRVDIDIFDR